MSSFTRQLLALFFNILLVVLGTGCRKSVEMPPEKALSAWVNAMELSRTEINARRVAFQYLSIRAQQSLTERAVRASQLSGRMLEPWEMLAPGRFLLRGAFEPWDAVKLSSNVHGDHAEVTARGRNDEQTVINMVLEQGVWRVDLELPPMQSIIGPTTPDAGVADATVQETSVTELRSPRRR